MEFQNERHKELHELLLQLGFELADKPFWNYAYIHNCHDGESVSFDYVGDYSIFSDKSKLISNLSSLTIDGVITYLRKQLLLLKSNDDSIQIKPSPVDSYGVISYNKYTPDEVAFLDAAALVLIQVEYQGKHLTYAEAYTEAVNMLKARRECLGGEHD